MSDYHFFYVDVDGITIRPPYPLRSESERRILGIDDFCWAYEAACTVTCQPRPAANRKARFDSRELNVFYWRAAVNMVKDCLTAQKYNALVGTTWFDEPCLFRKLYNTNNEPIDWPWPGKIGSDVFRVALSENSVFCSDNDLPNGIAELISRLDSDSRALAGMAEFWDCVSNLTTFFEHDGICSYDNYNNAVQFTAGLRQVTKTYASGASEVFEYSNQSGHYYQISFDNRVGASTIREDDRGSVEYYMTVTNPCFAMYIDRVLFPRTTFLARQQWTSGQGGFGDITNEWRVNDIVLTLTSSDGRDYQSGFRFDLPEPAGQASECYDLMDALGYASNDNAYSSYVNQCSLGFLAVFEMKFPWTAED